MTFSSQADRLARILTPSDTLAINNDGVLEIDGCSVRQLLHDFGSPLFAISERTIRTNYRRVLRAFEERWPAPVNVMYAIKANNNPAVRAVLADEGAGGDCFGLGELHATFLGGANPDRVAMNGSNKTEAELLSAMERDVYINIDAEEEIDLLASICARLDKTARVNLRLKVIPESYAAVGSDYFGLSTNVKECLENEKWGFSLPLAERLVRRILQTARLSLEGYSAHTGRFTRKPPLFREYTRALAEMVVALRRQTDFTPRILDIGGGWPRLRDPESRALELNPNPIEVYADEAVAGLREIFEPANISFPALWLEPGRYIIGNAAVLLGTAGAIKRDCDRIWVHADFSTNHLMRVDTAASAYHVLIASGMRRADMQSVQIVGPTCIDSRIAGALSIPDISAGDVLAVLDAGMYAETTSTQFNGTPRPATVLVRDGKSDLIKARETVEDLFRLTRIPQRLLAADAAGIRR